MADYLSKAQGARQHKPDGERSNQGIVTVDRRSHQSRHQHGKEKATGDLGTTLHQQQAGVPYCELGFGDHSAPTSLSTRSSACAITASMFMYRKDPVRPAS